jgi:formylglycine-generating enzyme required for sulfatase activity
MCYPPRDQIKAGIKLPAEYLQQTGYRLPTEAEWEYAARAWTTTSWSFGSSEDMLTNYAWYYLNNRGRTWPVGRLKPNDLGLFDVHGNLWEWCHSYWFQFEGRDNEDKKDQHDVIGRENWELRVMHGGAFDTPAQDTRSANRMWNMPADRNIRGGLRVARTYP